MMQGDEYKIPMEITTTKGPADGNTFADIEVFIGKVRKTFSSGGVSYDSDLKQFLVWVTQQETFRLREGKQPVQVRVKTKSGDVVGVSAGEISVEDAISKVVI